ncbi:hypothetical protein [Streptomyces sp. NPDC088789]|uniref:hypothetical protein n=1 Tax=Streptomyces sp. NPDC088789 TaxID=3365899 RepID=UPI00380C6E2F
MTRMPGCAAALALAAALLTGCGISATEPVESGGPAVIDLAHAPELWIMIFLQSPSGRLVPVFRERSPEVFAPPPSVLVEEAVETLFAGPSAAERANGMRGAPGPLRPDQKVRVVVDGAEQLTVLLPVPLSSLGITELRQLVCTAAFAHDRRGWTQVALRGRDGLMEGTVCDAGIDVIPGTARPSIR